MAILLVPASYDPITSKTVTVAECAEGKPLDAVIETTMGEMLPLAYGDDDYLAPRPEGLEDTTQFRA
jgi:cytidine deaminase